MSNFFKKHVPVTIGALMATSPVVLSADMDARLTKLESQMKDAGTQTARGNFGARTATANPNLDGYGFYLTADATLWQAIVDDAGYGLANTTTTAVDGTLKDTRFDWAWGFKVGLGYFAEHDLWDTGFGFTWFRDHASRSVSATSPNFVIPEHGNSRTLEVDSDYTTVSDSWKLHYYDLDWQVGRNFFVSKYLALRPYTGVTTTWLYNTRLDHAFNSTSNFHVHDKDNFWGIGPTMGLDAKMYFGKNFSLFAGTSGSLLWGNHCVDSTSTNVTTGLVDDNVKANFHRIMPVLNLALGLGYDTNFYSDNFNFGIKVGYESHYYFGANQMVKWEYDGTSAEFARTSRVNGDLMLHGFNVNLAFSF